VLVAVPNIVAAPDIAVLEHLLENTEAGKSTAGLGGTRWELIRNHKRAAAQRTVPESRLELLDLVDTGLRRALAGRRLDFECSLYTAYRIELELLYAFPEA
jgi:hypothetical protein